MNSRKNNIKKSITQKVSKEIMLFVLIAISVSAISARTKLTTLPERESIQVNLLTPGKTLVEEERFINLNQGINKVEFSWQNTAIEMSSIQFQPLAKAGEVTVLNVNYPPGSAALFWEVNAKNAGSIKFRISYLLRNLEQSFSYEAVADRSEKTMTLKQYVTLINNSGEAFSGAYFQVGQQKIFEKNLAHSEQKKMLALKELNIPVNKVYSFDANVSEDVRMFYEIINDKKNNLGKASIPAGKVRIFQEDSGKSEAFIGEDWGSYLPIGEKMNLFLGSAKEVRVKRHVFKTEKKIVNDPIYNEEVTLKYEVENFKKEKVALNFFEKLSGEWQVDKVWAAKEVGERDDKKEQDAGEDVRNLSYEKTSVEQLKTQGEFLPTKEKEKYVVFVKYIRKNLW